MKSFIYISGIAGGLLLVFWFLGIFMAFPYNNILLNAGLLLLGLICLPLILIDRHRRDKKIAEIIKSGKYSKKEKKPIKKGDSKIKGWGMNDSPFHERKAGLTWHGGNIHARNASRNTRRKFLK